MKRVFGYLWPPGRHLQSSTHLWPDCDTAPPWALKSRTGMLISQYLTAQRLFDCSRPSAVWICSMQAVHSLSPEPHRALHRSIEIKTSSSPWLSADCACDRCVSSLPSKRDARLRSAPAQRQARCRSNFRRAAIRAVVRRANDRTRGKASSQNCRIESSTCKSIQSIRPVTSQESKTRPVDIPDGDAVKRRLSTLH